MRSNQNPFESRPRAFISYARSDGESFATALRDRLSQEEPKITLWQDRLRMEGGVGWWKQITEAIDQVEILIMVVTPMALTSEVARKEWRYARQQGVRVCPVMGVAADQLNFAALPSWMHKVQFYDLQREWSTFVNFLKTAGKEERVPFMAPDLRDDFVQRPDEFEPLVSSLVDRSHMNPLAITTALKGSGGFGKTTLAIAVCHHEDVVTAFHDGILWATLGENPNIQHEMTKLYAALTGERPPFVDVDDASLQLAARLDEKNCLIVIDDVWDAKHAKPFLRGGKQCARLITTRLMPVVTELGAGRVFVNEMTADQSVRMLTTGIAPQPRDLEATRALAGRLGEWPLLLRLAASQIRERVERGDSLQGALAYVNRALDKRGAVAFDRANPTERNDAVAKTVATSLELLTPEDRRRCAELAIFPQDRLIPMSAVRALWQIDSFDAEELAQRLDGAALVDFDLKTACLRMHDVLQLHLRRQLGDVAAVHARLVHQGWGDLHALPDAYAWRWIGWHLAQAGELAQLGALLLDFDWLAAKLGATDVEALLQDFELQRHLPELRMVGDCLRLGTNGLAQDPHQLAAQLKGRLDRGRWAGIDRLLDQADARAPRPWLTFLRTSLTRPGGPLIGILKGHRGSVESVALSADGRRAISGSGDWTVRLWDLESGSSVRVLDGHSGMVCAVAIGPDQRRAVSGSEDRTVGVWDLERGAMASVLRGHYGAVTGVAFSPDGRLVASVSDDGTARVWNLDSGQGKVVLKGNSHQLRAIAVTADSRHVVIGADDWRILLVDIESSEVRRVFAGHAGIVKSLTLTADGRRMLSGSQDGTVLLWDLETAAVLQKLEGHLDSVDGVAVSADGRRAASASADQTVRIWSLEDLRQVQVRRLDGHSSYVRSVAISARGDRALSGAGDRSIRHWNLDAASEPAAVAARSDSVSFLTISPDGSQSISASRFGDVHVWRADGEPTPGGLDANAHRNFVTCLRVSADGRRALTGSRDKTVRVWDLESRRVEHVLTGHTRGVLAVETSADANRAVSLARDRTVRAWDVVNGRPLRLLVGADDVSALAGSRATSALLAEMELGPVVDLAPFPLGADGQIAISSDGWSVLHGSYDRMVAWHLKTGVTACEDIGDFDVVAMAIEPLGRWAVLGSRFGRLRIWDLEKHKTVRILEGHTGSILDIVIGAEGRLVMTASQDETIRAWDLETGTNRQLLHRRASSVDAVVIAPDGTFAYAVYGDTILTCDLVSWTRSGSLSLDHEITAVAVTPNGKRLVVGDRSGSVHFLQIS